MAKKSKKLEIEHEERYLAFLKKALDSKNFKALAATDPKKKEEYEAYKAKYEKAKFRLKILKK